MNIILYDNDQNKGESYKNLGKDGIFSVYLSRVESTTDNYSLRHCSSSHKYFLNVKLRCMTLVVPSLLT